MGRPRKYADLYGAQKAYLQTEKGKEILKKSQSSGKERERKKNWWRSNRAKISFDRQQYFIDTYGDPEPLLKLLDEKEKEVIALYYGLDGTKPLTLTAIAKEWGKSHQWISQIKKAALAKLEPLAKITPPSD